jgi:protein tyrosine phosphatase (PTP) superfamily phosphohydrolase (DUF442 family)
MLYTIATLLLTLQATATNEKEGLKDIRAFLQISERLATSGQIRYDQIETIKDAGYEVVVNLAPARKERNAEEGFRVTENGMTYVQIPVSWEEPALRDLQLFFDVMDANRDRKVYVHCFANMRVSVFVYLYRTLRLGESEETTRGDLAKIWDPATEKQWEDFIKKAQAKMTQ